MMAHPAGSSLRCPPPPIHCAPWRGSSSRGGHRSTGRPSIRTRRSPPRKARSTRASSPAIGARSRATTTASNGSRSSTVSAASMPASRSTIPLTGPSPGSAARSPSETGMTTTSSFMSSVRALGRSVAFSIWTCVLMKTSLFLQPRRSRLQSHGVYLVKRKSRALIGS